MTSAPSSGEQSPIRSNGPKSAVPCFTRNDTESNALTHYTQLHWLALRGDDVGIRELLATEPSTNVNALSTAKEQLGQAPLHWAAIEGHTSTVSLLLSYSANPNILDASGYSTAAYAAMNSHLDTLHVLLLSTPSLATVVDVAKHTPLHWAAHNGHERIVAYLLHVAGASVDAVDADGKTPLHRAARGSTKGHVAVARHLIRAGASPLVSDHSTKSPLDLARDRHMQAVVAQAFLTQNNKGPLSRFKPYSGIAALHILVIVTYMQYVGYVSVHSPMGVMGNCLFHSALFAVLAASHLTCWTSPGYGPKRNAAEFVRYIEEASQWGITDRAFSSDAYCFFCFAERTQRSKHSRLSDRCVIRFDHTCPFVANDIGIRNHRSLVCLLVSAVIAMVLFLRSAIAALASEVSSNKAIGAILLIRWWAVVLLIVLLVVLAFTSVLLSTQCMLIARNDTQGARIGRARHVRSPEEDIDYDLGVYQNCLDFFFMSGSFTVKSG